MYEFSEKAFAKEEAKQKRKALFLQKLCGLGLLVLSALILWLITSLDSASMRDKDGTAVILITIPLGLYLLFSKKYILR